MSKELLCLAVCATLLVSGSPAYAALVEQDLFTAGDGLLTLDTDTNLEWLDVTETLGQAF